MMKKIKDKLKSKLKYMYRPYYIENGKLVILCNSMNVLDKVKNFIYKQTKLVNTIDIYMPPLYGKNLSDLYTYLYEFIELHIFEYYTTVLQNRLYINIIVYNNSNSHLQDCSRRCVKFFNNIEFGESITFKHITDGGDIYRAYYKDSLDHLYYC